MTDDTGKIPVDRRKYPRYDTDIEVYYQVKYETKTRVEFEVIDRVKEEGAHKKYLGICKNISAEGLCFASKKKLAIGDILLLEVYEPLVKNPVKMEGQVRWCKEFPESAEEKGMFRTGVQLTLVNDRSVADSIYFDKKYKVMWSAVLDSLFGSFASLKK